MRSTRKTLAIFGIFVSYVQGRKIDIRLNVVDPKRSVLVEEYDPFKVTLMPSNQPSQTPSVSPTLTPSISPTISQIPTKKITTLTTAPSATPSTSEQPTADKSDIPGYFNYDPSDKKYGPDAWDAILDTPENKTWAKFPQDVWAFDQDNQCGYGKRQSPIDVCDGVGDGKDLLTTEPLSNVNSACFEYHRAFTEARDWTIDDKSKMKMEILPTKLRLQYALRDCKYQQGHGVKAGGSPVWFPLPKSKGGIHDWCDYEPPAIDFPNHWNGHIQPIHIDVKFPSEHTLCGKRYEGEFVVWHAHPQRQAIITMATFITVGSHNMEMQKAIDEWQKKFNEDKWACMRRRNRKLREEKRFKNRLGNVLETGINHEHVSVHDNNYEKDFLKEQESSTWTDLRDDSDEHIDQEEKEFLKQYHRRTKQDNVFNPYHDEIYRSKWFYGYWGSLTEPPCFGRSVTHRIMDAPMEVSELQLEQMKYILFEHIDDQCQKSSADFQGSVARPQQPFNNRTLWRCNRERWEHDFEAWRCNGHEGTQYGCVRDGQTMIDPTKNPTGQPSPLK